MKSVLEVTEPQGISVIEDVAESLGAETSGKKLGSWGLMACHT